MTPNALQDRAASMTELYGKAELRMISAIAKRISAGKAVSNWQQKKLDEVQAMHRQLKGIVNDLADKSLIERGRLMEEAYKQGWMDNDRALEEIYRDNDKAFKTVPVARFAASSELMKELDKRFDALDSAILRDCDDAYRSIIGNVVALQSTGIMTTRDAVKEALNNFADRGIVGFTDKAGRKWQMDSYANMAVRTGMMRASLQGLRDDMAAHGEHLVIITDHMDTCPLCRDWERKILAIDMQGLFDSECDGLLSDAEAAGLFHPNCLHAMTPYVSGLTNVTGMKEARGYTAEQDAEGYRNRQTQRYMESNIRRWKRRQAAAIDPQDERYAKAMVDRWQARIRQHVADSDLPRQYWREGGRVKLTDAAKKLKPVQLTPIKPSSTIKAEQPKPKTLKDVIANYKKRIDDAGILSTQDFVEAGRAVWSEYEQRLKHIDGDSYTRLHAEHTEVIKRYNSLKIDVEDLFTRFKEATLKYGANSQQADDAFDKWQDLESKLQKLATEANALRDRVIEAYNNRGDGSANALRTLLSEYRNVTNLDSKTAVKTVFTGNARKSKATDDLLKALNYYPSDWTNLIVQRGGVKGAEKANERAFCRGIGYIQTDGKLSTSIHEWAHIMDAHNEAILNAERDFYDHRTAGLSLEWMGAGYGKDEVTRRDSFVNEYMGKDYGGYAFELTSMAFQYLYTEPERLAADPEMRAWALGVLFLA